MANDEPLRPSYIVASAFIRRGEDVLLVLQSEDGSAPFWTLPGGTAEHGELIHEALVREVKEETGLDTLSVGPLAYVGQMDSRVPSADRPEGHFSTIYAFEVAHWKGELEVDDPDGDILEARFHPMEEAVRKLAKVPYTTIREPASAYLSGHVDAGAIWLFRRDAPGPGELVTRLPD